jgi:carbon monoxide dehydrogenase subunit G
MTRALIAVSLLGLFLARPAAASAASGVELQPVPGSEGKWEQGSVVVPAPAESVREWLTDFRAWPLRFPDIEKVAVLGHTADGRTIVRFRSSIVGRPITVRVKITPNGLVYDGQGKNVTTQGRVFIVPLGPERTRVIMQSTSSVSGFLSIFATQRIKRERTREKLRSDLTALLDLAAGPSRGRSSR